VALPTTFIAFNGMDISMAVRDFLANAQHFLRHLQTDGEKLREGELAILSSHLHEISLKVQQLQDLLLFKARGKNKEEGSI
jgi:GAF domain-containing protein